MRSISSPAVISAVALSLLLGGCGIFTEQPTVLLPAPELYAKGNYDLERKRYEDARASFRKIVERFPNSSLAPQARFLIGEGYYRDADFEKAIKEFQAFMAFYPRHMIADLVQYRLAMSYYDQLKPVEQDQGLTAKAVAEFQKLIKEYPESRYAPDALAKIDIGRGRLAQKELWIANYYYQQGNMVAARQRLEVILKDYPRTLVVPETLFLLAEVNLKEGLTGQATANLRRLAEEYPHTEWGRRAAQRLNTAARGR
jgi:outer membrane protein assembly factor BamD